MSWRPPASSWGAVAALGAAACLAACAAPPPAAPDLRPTLDHRAGDALGYAAPGAGPEADPASAWALQVEWLWLPDAEREAEGLVPAGAQASAVVGTGSFDATPRLDDTARVALGEGARNVAARLRGLAPPAATVVARQEGALPAGVTAVTSFGSLSIELSRHAAATGAGLAVVREGQVPLGVALPGGEAEATSGVAGGEHDDESGDEADAAAPADEAAVADQARRRAAQEPVAWRDVLVLDVPLLPDGPPAVIALPGGPRGTAIVALIELRTAPPDEAGLARQAELVARALDGVAASAARDADRLAAVDAAESKHRRLLTAARSMAQAGDQRRAAVFLASEAGAELALDTLLAADAPSLASLGAAWRESVGTDLEALVRGDTLAWSLERTAALWLARGADAGTLPAELESVLLRQTGVVGRSPSLLEQFAEESEGLDDWRERLMQENRSALEDHLPAARVRAFDWLASRGLAPPAYDPLGSRAERRAALASAEEAP